MQAEAESHAAARHEEALRFVDWSRIWSPIAPDDMREAAWRALALPGRWPEIESAFMSAFVIGLPAPTVPLLLHATLGREGGAVREDWMRVIGHLDLRWTETTLPPDHLGAACEVLACAILRDESVLVRELRRRYLEPWCAVAAERLAGEVGAIARLPHAFAEHLRATG